MDCFAALAMTVCKCVSAPSRRNAPELLKILRPSRRGRRERRALAAPAVSCAKLCEETHTSIQVQSEHPGIPCAMVLRLMPRSPRRRIRLVTVIGELAILPDPVGPEKTSADLTPATGARTTRFCRTRQRRSPGAPVIAHRPKPALQSRFTPDAVASTASLPNVADDHDAPLCGPGRRKL